MPVVPTTQETRTGGSFEPGSWRPFAGIYLKEIKICPRKHFLRTLIAALFSLAIN
jgi:hypothetical protein